MAHPKRALVCLASGAASLACLASAPLRAETAADPRLGAEVDHLCVERDFNRFELADGRENAVIFRRGAAQFYLVELSGACTDHELRYANAVIVDTRPSDSCLSRGDYLLFSRSTFFQDSPIERTRCLVERIYHWNPKAKATDNKAAPAPSKPK